MRLKFFTLIIIFACIFAFLPIFAAQAVVCPDLVVSEGTDYCPTISNGTRCSTDGGCGPAASELPARPHAGLQCNTCTYSCPLEWADCDRNMVTGCEQYVPSGECVIGGQAGTYTGDKCERICTANPQYVSRQFVVEPGEVETGFINVRGNMRSGGDLYLNSGKAIRIDGVDAVLGTSLNIGNYDDGGSADRDFHLRLHASDLSIPEILFQQGTEDYWSISLRTPSHNLEIWRNNIGGWDEVPILAIEHSTGEIIINSGFTVNNGLVVAGNITLSTANATIDGKNLDNIVIKPSPCGANQIIQWSGTVWVCANISSGLATSGDATINKIPKFIGTPLMLTDSMLTENGNTVSVGGNITATGCFGPVFAGKNSTNADEMLNGARGGYTEINDLCSHLGVGSHVCSTEEILNSIKCRNSAILSASGAAWIVNGPPAFLALANDCNGWHSDANDAYGNIWEFGATGGLGHLTSCNTEHHFTCCK